MPRSYTTTTVVLAPSGAQLGYVTTASGRLVVEARPAPDDASLSSLTRTISSSISDMSAVRMIQRNYRGYRDMRETELGFSLRKGRSDGGVDEVLGHVLRLVGTGVERPAGDLTPRKKHELLSQRQGLACVCSLGSRCSDGRTH